MPSIEILRASKGGYRCALFDFDGTISLIREGWQGVMVPYFCETLSSFALDEDETTIEKEVRGFVDALTGKQTIFQCIALCEAVKKRGGTPLSPGAYKAEYLRRLALKTAGRKAALAEKNVPPEAYTVKGAFDFLRSLQRIGVTCFLASGTDEEDVKNEARLLGADVFFNGGIFGVREDLTDCSKEAVIRDLLQNHALSPAELIGFGDGFVEISLVHEAGGYAVGVAADEKNGGLDKGKRDRLIKAGADMIAPDFSDPEALLRALLL